MTWLNGTSSDPGQLAPRWGGGYGRNDIGELVADELQLVDEAVSSSLLTTAGERCGRIAHHGLVEGGVTQRPLERLPQLMRKSRPAPYAPRPAPRALRLAPTRHSTHNTRHSTLDPRHSTGTLPEVIEEGIVFDAEADGRAAAFLAESREQRDRRGRRGAQRAPDRREQRVRDDRSRPRSPRRAR